MKQLRECIPTVQDTYVNLQQLDFVVEMEWKTLMVTKPTELKVPDINTAQEFIASA